MTRNGYWEKVRKRARELDSDGCTMGSGLFEDCCLEHDIHYRTHKNVDGEPIGRKEADERFLHCMQRRSFFGWWSPTAWLRFAAVRLFGRFVW